MRESMLHVDHMGKHYSEKFFLDRVTLEDFRSFLPVCMILTKEDSHMYRCITHSWFKVLVIPWFKV
jgi:hypothetical protein